MRIVENPINMCSDDPIELRAFPVCSGKSPYSFHRIEYRMRQSHFDLQYGNGKIFPEGGKDAYCVEEYKNWLGLTRERKVKMRYTNPWRYYEYRLPEGYCAYHYFVTDKIEEFERLKTQLRTYGDYITFCEEKEETVIEIANRSIKKNSCWY